MISGLEPATVPDAAVGTQATITAPAPLMIAKSGPATVLGAAVWPRMTIIDGGAPVPRRGTTLLPSMIGRLGPATAWARVLITGGGWPPGGRWAIKAGGQFLTLGKGAS
jgi:hypothetical protein